MFVGSATVLESVSSKSSVSSHSVRLQLKAMPYWFEHAPSYEQPDAEYDVRVCGDGPFKGALILQVNARLIDPHVDDRLKVAWKVEPPQFGYDEADPQVISFTLDQTPPCASSFNDNDLEFFKGAPFIVRGLLRSPVINQSHFGPWQGPTYWESWPRMGSENSGFRNVSENTYGLSGFWTDPETTLTVVESLEPPISMSVELARPATAPAESNPLVWRSLAPIGPTARIVNDDQLAHLQALLILMSVAFGIGASLATSILVQAIQSDGDRCVADVVPGMMPSNPIPPTRGRDRQATMRNAQLALLGLVVGLMLGRRRGRRE
jgi:hypothetical protein